MGFSELKLAHLIYAFEGGAPSLKGDPPDFLTLKIKSTANLRFGAINMDGEEVMHSVANIDPLLMLGWKPEVQLEEGMDKLIESLQ